ncbi:MAG TPA: Na+/H+ antiporter NhaA [Alphaproteobacteria bacterium]|nr:Na+/H+ antiporter NhaA [Alphaproteobacteria bacterium]
MPVATALLKRPVRALREFLRLEAAGGLVMLAASAVALIVANSPLLAAYESFLALPVGITVGPLALNKTLLLFVNDALMAVFFLLVGLEIKREILEGELSTPALAALPGVAAIGGMAVPALIYVGVNWAHPENLAGWAIPAATDIAFALVVLQLCGARVPLALKVLLTAIAVFDDLGAIVIIALFYTAQLSLPALALAAGAVAGLALLNLTGVRRVAPYVIVGVFLWVCVLKSGVHATLAGVVLALAIPMRGGGPDEAETPLARMEHALHPWVAFMILPLFGFANAGVSFAGMTLDSALQPVTLGIALGLLAGKTIGIFGALWLAVRSGLAPRPPGTTWPQLLALAVLCGIGFTMSLFIGNLAFPAPEMAAPVRLGVIGGSVAAAVIGFAAMRLAVARAAAGR